jgi:F-type H+-transporting ATPase subunit a
MEHELATVVLLNRFFKWLFSLVGIEIGEIPAHAFMAALAALLIVAFFRIVVRKLICTYSEEDLIKNPGKMQIFIEMLYKFFRSLIDDFIGEEGRKFIPAVTTLGIFIAVSNLLGLLPEMGSPTANLNTTVACAIFIFIYYHYQGIKKHGLGGYLKTFMGPAWWLAPIFFPIEVISHFSRPLSLSFRLFGNIFGEDYVIIIVAFLIPFIAPLPMMAFAIFTSLLQAFIFVMLSLVYLSGAVAEEH